MATAMAIAMTLTMAMAMGTIAMTGASGFVVGGIALAVSP
jgi:hypothetical protein